MNDTQQINDESAREELLKELLKCRDAFTAIEFRLATSGPTFAVMRENLKENRKSIQRLLIKYKYI